MKIKFLNKCFSKVNLTKEMMLWLVGITSIIAGLEIAWLNNVIQQIYTSDITKLSTLIAVIFFWQTLQCGVAMWQLTRENIMGNSSNTLDSGWMWSDIVLSLGMIGTVIGFTVMLSGFGDVDFSNIDNVQGVIVNLSAGMSTSLSTTLVGLITSVILKLQFFLLESVITDKEKMHKIL
jgi:hypothetical protein